MPPKMAGRCWTGQQYPPPPLPPGLQLDRVRVARIPSLRQWRRHKMSEPIKPAPLTGQHLTWRVCLCQTFFVLQYNRLELSQLCRRSVLVNAVSADVWITISRRRVVPDMGRRRNHVQKAARRWVHTSSQCLLVPSERHSHSSGVLGVEPGQSLSIYRRGLLSTGSPSSC